jgi:hypothetical protein
MYSCVPGGKGGPTFFSQDFFGAHFMYKLVYYNLYHVSYFAGYCLFLCKIECNEFVCNKFVSNLVQIDLKQFEF